MFVGRGRVLEFNENSFTPGKPHVVDVACDLWPTIVYQGEKGYKGLEVTVAKAPIDDVKVVAVRNAFSLLLYVLMCLNTLLGEEEHSRALQNNGHHPSRLQCSAGRCCRCRHVKIFSFPPSNASR